MKITEIIVNVILRTMFGAIGIYCINTLMQAFSLDYMVGLNQWTVAAVGVLGLPGVALLYAVRLVGVL